MTGPGSHAYPQESLLLKRIHYDGGNSWEMERKRKHLEQWEKRVKNQNNFIIVIVCPYYLANQAP